MMHTFSTACAPKSSRLNLMQGRSRPGHTQLRPTGPLPRDHCEKPVFCPSPACRHASQARLLHRAHQNEGLRCLLARDGEYPPRLVGLRVLGTSTQQKRQEGCPEPQATQTLNRPISSRLSWQVLEGHLVLLAGQNGTTPEMTLTHI